MPHYYAPVFDRVEDGQRLRSPGSVEAWVTPVGDTDPDTGVVTPGTPVQQWGVVSIVGAKCYLDEAVPRFVVNSPVVQTYSDWDEVEVSQVVTDYGSEVV